MGKSSIAKQRGWGPRSVTAVELGRRVRAWRLRRGMTQGELGRPLSRAYISALENGLTLPSLGTLLLLSERLGVTAGELIDGVNQGSNPSYTLAHDVEAANQSSR